MSDWKNRSVGKGLVARRSAAAAAPAATPATVVRRAAAAAVEPLEDRRLMSITLVSTAAGGGGGNGPSGRGGDAQVTSDISNDGRYVAFASAATNLVANDTNGKTDVFVKDTQTGTVTLVSSTPAGTPGNDDSGEATGPDDTGFAISGNGRFVAFASAASDLVPNDTNGGTDLFVKDLQTGTVSLVTVNAAGTGPGVYDSATTQEQVWGRPAISDDGRYIAFSSTANDLAAGQEATDLNPDTFLRDTQANTTTQLTKPAAGAAAGNGSFTQSISGDGRYVVFVSGDEIVAGQDGLFEQVYLYDTSAKTFALVSGSADGSARGNGHSQRPQISADGRHVVFQSTASNLVAGQTRNPNQLGSDFDLFYRNLDTNATQLVSRKAGTTTAGGNEGTGAGSISGDGKFVAFYSDATDIAAGVTDANDSGDAFLFDTTTGTLTTLSVKAGGGSTATQGAGALSDEPPAISANGKTVVYGSFSNDIVDGDGNAVTDLFAYDTGTRATRRLLEGQALPGGADVLANTERPAVSADGTRIAFVADGFGLPGNDVGSGALPAFQVYLDAPGGGTGNPGEPDPGQGNGTIDVVPSVTATLPAAVVAGQKAKAAVTVLVTNNGTGLLNGPVTVKLFASQDATAGAGDAEIAAVTKRLKLRAGQGKAVKLKVGSFPAVADGDYFVVADVTGTGGAADGNAANNQAAAANKVTIAAPFVDLTGATNTPPKAVRAGRAGTLVLDVANGGNTVAAGTSAVRLTLTPAAGGAPVTVDAPAKLKVKAGGSAKLKLKFAVPATLAAGTYTVTADLDPANTVVEKNDANNAAGPVSLTVLA